MTPEIRLELTVLGIKPVRHKPTRCHAVEITRTNYFELVTWVNSNGGDATHYDPVERRVRHDDDAFWIRTLQGIVPARFGNYLIVDVDNFYPITAETFALKYEDEVRWEE